MMSRKACWLTAMVTTIKIKRLMVQKYCALAPHLNAHYCDLYRDGEQVGGATARHMQFLRFCIFVEFSLQVELASDLFY